MSQGRFLSDRRWTWLVFVVVVGFFVTYYYWDGSEDVRTPQEWPGNYQVPQDWPTYFHLLQRGYQYERQGQYKEAIAIYSSALQYTEEIAPDLVVRAKIALYNRIGACYRALGDYDAALQAFAKSVALGDKRYAPKAVEKLKAQRAKIIQQGPRR